MRIQKPFHMIKQNYSKPSVPKDNHHDSVKLEQQGKGNEGKDILELSQEAKAEKEKAQIKKEFEAANQSTKKQAKTISDSGKCLIIAQRIVKGDKVSRQDTLFLQEKNPDLYKQSIMLRMKSDDPKEHKSISGNEEKPTAISRWLSPSEDGSTQTPSGGMEQIIASDM